MLWSILYCVCVCVCVRACVRACVRVCVYTVESLQNDILGTKKKKFLLAVLCIIQMHKVIDNSIL